MKKILFLLFFPIALSAQYATTSYVTLNEGMEKDYLKIEELWSEYHKEAVKNGHKSSWAIWKVDPTGYDDKVESSRIPHFMIVETYNNKTLLDEESDRYDTEGMKKIKTLIKQKLKGKISNRNINKILSKNVEKERRSYIHQGLAGTPLTGGSLKAGDIMRVTPMKQLEDDYEKYETEFYQKIFSNNVMKGNHRWWAFSKIIDRSENALTFGTHSAWNIGIKGKQLDLPKDFASQKIMEITGTARKMYNPTTYELVYIVD
jgi:hypothetical protein|tara:strand:+ start:293 stop:1072 length:780 start_codon:yes stop_codon:yes gene_type:complete